jgi:hypothetical protein
VQTRFVQDRVYRHRVLNARMVASFADSRWAPVGIGGFMWQKGGMKFTSFGKHVVCVNLVRMHEPNNERVL